MSLFEWKVQYLKTLEKILRKTTEVKLQSIYTLWLALSELMLAAFSVIMHTTASLLIPTRAAYSWKSRVIFLEEPCFQAVAVHFRPHAEVMDSDVNSALTSPASTGPHVSNCIRLEVEVFWTSTSTRLHSFGISVVQNVHDGTFFFLARQLSSASNAGLWTISNGIMSFVMQEGWSEVSLLAG